MDHATYLKNFSRIVRWTLPKAEAEAALADYREILDQYSQEHASDLVERLGTPEQAAELLMDRCAYHRWLTAFFVMLLCLLLPEWWLTKTAFFNTPLISLTAVVYVLFVLGAVAALVWFRFPASREKTPQPKGLLPTAVSLLVLFAAILAYTLCKIDQLERAEVLPRTQERYQPYWGNFALPVVVVAYFLVDVTILPPRQVWLRLISDSAIIFFHATVYFVVLMLLLPWLRRHISARTCGFLWLGPNFL